MKTFGVLIVIFIFCIPKCSLDSGNKFLREIYDYDPQDKDYPLSSTKSPTNRLQHNEEHYDEDYDNHWFPAKEINVKSGYRHSGPRNRFRKRKLNKKRRRIPRLRGTHFDVDDNDDMVPLGGRLHKRPKYDHDFDVDKDEIEEEEEEDKQDSKVHKQWRNEQIGDDFDRKLAAREEKTKLNAEMGREDRCQDSKNCKGKESGNNFVNVSYVFIPGEHEIAFVKEVHTNSTGHIVDGKHHGDQSLEGGVSMGKGSNTVTGDGKECGKTKQDSSDENKSDKSDQQTSHVLVINRLVNCEIVKPNTTSPNNSTDGKKEDPNSSCLVMNMPNMDENRKACNQEKNACEPPSNPIHELHHHNHEETDKSTEKPKEECDNKTSKGGCKPFDELESNSKPNGEGLSNKTIIENPGKQSPILMINKFMKCEVMKPKDIEGNDGVVHVLTGEEVHEPLSSKNNNEAQFARRGTEDLVLDGLPKQPLTIAETKSKYNNKDEETEKELNLGTDHSHKDHDSNVGNQYDNLKFQLGNEIFNCTAVRLGNFLASPKPHKEGQEFSAENVDLGMRNVGTGANRTAGLNLNITINGVVLSSNKAKKLYGNGTIRLAPEHKKKRERHERGIKLPFMKKLMNTREDNEQPLDDERDERLRDDKDDKDDGSMCRPKNKTKGCNATGRPRRPPEGGSQQQNSQYPLSQQNQQNQQQQQLNKTGKDGPLNDAAAEAGVSSMKLSNEIVKMVSQMVCSNPKMRTLWPSLSKNKPFLSKSMQTPLRSSAKCSERKHIEDMVRRAMASVNEIIEFEIQARSCVPLSDDLAEFYEKILSTHAKQARRKEEREEMLNKAETLDDSGGGGGGGGVGGGGDEPKQQKHREGKRSKGSEDPNEDFQENSLFDMIHSRKMEYEREVQEDRQRREASRRLSRFFDDESNSSLIRQLRHLYTPAFIKLNSAADSFERAETMPDIP